MISIQEALSEPGSWLADEYDLVVVGAGHAGCEAALAAARSGCKTALFTMNLDSVANMPCNPNIGGTAKGQLVREIDALGGEMGKLADRYMLQFRMLNASKGPAVQSPRAQMDRRRYQIGMKQVLEQQPGLFLRQGEIVTLLTEPLDQSGQSLNQGTQPLDQAEPFRHDELAEAHSRIVGVLTKTKAIYRCKAVILATGTYLNSRIIIGETIYAGGPDGLFPAIGLTDSLRALGLPIVRFKTGTPARIHARSVNTAGMERQDGDSLITPFSFEHEQDPRYLSFDQQPCWLTWTSDRTRQVITSNLHRSPLYSGVIEGVGPRYCPSIEDKYVKFPDKLRHQIFIEPTGRDTDEMYVQGFSSSLPEEVQLQMIRSLPGLENGEIMRSAYAIEYDCLDPTCLRLSLESRQIAGLFCSGQINGSSGYEEAAAQGLMAGINAARSIKGLTPVILDRSQAYIGVLIDDLVTKGTSEPYRMMTARAEYRLLLRQDNADRRLTDIGYAVGLISESRRQVFQAKQQRIEQEIRRCRQTRIQAAADVNALLADHSSSPIRQGVSLADLLRRPELAYADLAPLDPERPPLGRAEQAAVEVELKYEGYIRLEQDRINKFQRMEQRLLPDDLPYLNIHGLRLEARQKLNRLKPASLGQAGRISGVSPADIAVLLIYLEQRGMKGKGESQTHGR